jgi:hypothetical protein
MPHLGEQKRWVRRYRRDNTPTTLECNGFVTSAAGCYSPSELSGKYRASFNPALPLPRSSRSFLFLGGKARVIYADGEALFDGTPSTLPNEPLAIPMGRDQWRPRRSDDEAVQEAAVRRRVTALDDERKRLIFPLRGWTEADCVSAIEALTAQIDASIPPGALESSAGSWLRMAFIVYGHVGAILIAVARFR